MWVGKNVVPTTTCKLKRIRLVAHSLITLLDSYTVSCANMGHLICMKNTINTIALAKIPINYKLYTFLCTIFSSENVQYNIHLRTKFGAVFLFTFSSCFILQMFCVHPKKNKKKKTDAKRILFAIHN